MSLTDEVMEDVRAAGIKIGGSFGSGEYVSSFIDVKGLAKFVELQRKRESDRIKELEKIAARYQALKDLALTPQIRKSFAISKYTGFEWEPYELGGINLDEELDKLISEVLESDK